MNSGGQVSRREGAASGTYVTGPGSDIEDRVPLDLSPGEFVMDAQATQRIGPGTLQALNEGQTVGPRVPAQPQPINLTVYLGDEQITDRMRIIADDRISEDHRRTRAMGP